jgi:hypothetical protein
VPEDLDPAGQQPTDHPAAGTIIAELVADCNPSWEIEINLLNDDVGGRSFHGMQMVAIGEVLKFAV